MTAKERTAWYRPPELWAGTMDDHLIDADQSYGPPLDVWSFGAVVYEVLSGEILARRSGSGAAMVQAVTDIIGACPTQGLWTLEYVRG